MTPNTHDDKENEGQEPNEEIRDELDQIEGGLRGGLDEDSRLSSGVPDAQRGDDLDFIQMSGLTSPATANGDMDEEFPNHDDHGTQEDDPSRPVCFYEKGIADVDSEMTPKEEPPLAPAPEKPSPEEQRPSPVAGLRDIVEDLSSGEAGSMKSTEADDTATRDIASEEESSASDPERPPAEEEASSSEEELPGLAADSPQWSEKREPAPPETGYALPPTDLSQAERLLDELESQPRDAEPMAQGQTTAGPDPARNEEPDSHWQAEQEEEEGVESDNTPSENGESRETNDSVYNRPHGGRSRRRKHRLDRKQRKLFRWIVVGVLIVALAGAGWQAYLFLKPQVATPKKLLRDAGQLAAEGKHAKAARVYHDFAVSLPAHPAREEALFGAAFEYYSVPEDTPAAREYYQKALKLFETFVSEYPDRADRVARAETLEGILHFKLGEYRKAIDVLHKPDLRLRDPSGALPAMRTLARSFVAIQDYDAARSAYLQAASITDNPSPDLDYQELGNLYHALMTATDDGEEREHYAELAIEQWKQALRVDAIDPVREKEIEIQLEVLEAKVQSGALLGTEVLAPEASDAAAPQPPAPALGKSEPLSQSETMTGELPDSEDVEAASKAGGRQPQESAADDGSAESSSVGKGEDTDESSAREAGSADTSIQAQSSAETARAASPANTDKPEPAP